MPSRLCDHCGRPYYRCNVQRGWTSQAPGKRAGWIKEEVHLCTYCQPAVQTRRAMIAVQAKVLSVREANKLRKQLAPPEPKRRAAG